MPTPGKEEKEKDFMQRCIPIVIDEGTAKDGPQAAAICHSMWQEHMKKMQGGGESLYHDVAIEPRAAEAEGTTFEGREWEVTIIGHDAGDLVSVGDVKYLRSKNNRLYNLKALAESVQAWEGVKVYDNHLTDQEFQDRAGMRSVAREWIGSIVNPTWDAAKNQLRGVLKVVEESVARKLKNAWDAGILKTIGLSIDTLTVPGQEAIVEGRPMPTVEGFQKILSVDLVAEPAAGGGFNRLIAANTQAAPVTGQEAQNMDEKQLKELVTRLVTEALVNRKVDDNKKEALIGVVYQAALGAKAVEAEDVEAAVKPLVEALVIVEPASAPVAAEPPAEPEKVDPPASDAGEVTQSLEAKVEKLKCQVMLEKRLNAAKLDEAHRRLVEGIFDGKIYQEAELMRAIENAKAAQARNDPSGRVSGAGSGPAVVGPTMAQRAELEFMRIVMGNSAFRGLESVDKDYLKERLPESYSSWVKDGRPRDYGLRRISEWMYNFYGDPFTDTPARASEAVTTSTMTSIVKNTVNIMIANDYARRHEWWNPIARTEEVDTIDDATLVRVYGLNTLAVVDEGQAYTELAWQDEEETASFAKRGNYVGITMETLLRDKLNSVRSLPTRLATSWYNTLSSLVSGVFTTNTAAGPVLGTTGALFNASAVTGAGGHANLLTTALSYTSYGAARLAMMKQTDQPLGVGQRLLIEPRFMLIPTDLESAALQIRNSEHIPGSGNNDINAFYQKFDIVVVPDWTDTNNWALVGDPAQFPAIWMIFLRGRRVPELFTAGDETSGAMFTNDTLRYKVRMLSFRFSSTYDVAPVSDFRPLHKSNVT